MQKIATAVRISVVGRVKEREKCHVPCAAALIFTNAHPSSMAKGERRKQFAEWVPMALRTNDCAHDALRYLNELNRR